MSHSEKIPPFCNENLATSGDSEARAIDILRRAYAEVTRMVSASKAQTLWGQVTHEKHVKPGRRQRSGLLENFELCILYLYDELKNDPGRQYLIHDMAEIIYNNTYDPNRPGRKKFTTLQALEKRIRRLVSDRDSGKIFAENIDGDFLPKYVRK